MGMSRDVTWSDEHENFMGVSSYTNLVVFQISSLYHRYKWNYRQLFVIFSEKTGKIGNKAGKNGKKREKSDY